jgi:hypothetical protein
MPYQATVVPVMIASPVDVVDVAVESKHNEVRYLDIHEDDPLDEAQFADWVKQASQLPGERM